MTLRLLTIAKDVWAASHRGPAWIVTGGINYAPSGCPDPIAGEQASRGPFDLDVVAAGGSANGVRYLSLSQSSEVGGILIRTSGGTWLPLVRGGVVDLGRHLTTVTVDRWWITTGDTVLEDLEQEMSPDIVERANIDPVTLTQSPGSYSSLLPIGIRTYIPATDGYPLNDDGIRTFHAAIDSRDVRSPIGTLANHRIFLQPAPSDYGVTVELRGAIQVEQSPGVYSAMPFGTSSETAFATGAPAPQGVAFVMKAFVGITGRLTLPPGELPGPAWAIPLRIGETHYL